MFCRNSQLIGMRLTKKIQQRRKEKERALYVRLPHVIRDEQDVARLFTGDFKVKLLRQSSKYCYVIFSDVEEKVRNLEAAKNVRVNGKRVVIAPADMKLKVDPQKLMRKKIVIPKVKKDIKVTKALFISNIKCGTKLDELRAAIPGCLSIKMLKPYSQKSRGAVVKMQCAQLAAEYLKGIREKPVVGGRKLRINSDTRAKHKTKTKRKSSSTLKIYDGDKEITEIFSKKRGSGALDHIVLQNDS